MAWAGFKEKGMKNHFSFDEGNGDFTLHETLEKAKIEADKALDFYRDQSCDDGWPGPIEGSIGYGTLSGICVLAWSKKKEDFTEEEWEGSGLNGDFDVFCDYQIKEIEK
jgi:hypothetical protein